MKPHPLITVPATVNYPPPGSYEARARGCRCERWDAKGVPYSYLGRCQWRVKADCPVHGDKSQISA